MRAQLMLEGLIALSIFAVLAVTALVSSHQGWLALMQLGLCTLGMGTVLSLLTGGMYHVRLAQSAACRAGRVPRWWWAPTRLHPYLTAQEALRVMPWFWAGATSFLLVCLGAVWAVLGVSRMQ